MSKLGTALPWSYSSLQAYETCPKRVYLTRITKQVVEAQTEATTHGNRVHKALEQYVGGKAGLSESMAAYKPMADKIKTTPGEKLLEYRFGLTKALTPTTFFADDVWCRGVLDVNIVRPALVITLDYKTGKRKLDTDQLRMFAGAALSLWPKTKKVKTGYIWLSTGQIDTEEFTQEDKLPIWQDFAHRVSRMEQSEKTGDWPANPSGLCREWCPVGKKLCQYCGKP